MLLLLPETRCTALNSLSDVSRSSIITSRRISKRGSIAAWKFSLGLATDPPLISGVQHAWYVDNVVTATHYPTLFI